MKRHIVQKKTTVKIKVQKHVIVLNTRSWMALFYDENKLHGYKTNNKTEKVSRKK